jgi:transcriptional regulator with XRE-family HTH domain
MAHPAPGQDAFTKLLEGAALMPPNPVAVRFSENLDRSRKRAGISQEDLAVRSGVHRTEISILERGGRVPRIDTVVKLAGGLEIAPGDLLDGISWAAAAVVSGGFTIE